MTITSPAPFTLHVRLTKACNADCSYCSSWQENPSEQMSPGEYEKSIIYIIKKWKELDIKVDYLTIEYVGGEILLIPKSKLTAIVKIAREIFGKHGIKVYDGAQSNLIGSPSRVEYLFDLFEGRVGTSIDQVTDQRTFGGSPQKYRVFMMKSEENIVSKGYSHVPAVFTMDGKSIQHTQKQINMAEDQGRNITIRPVFQGGCNIEPVTTSQVTEAMVLALDNWFLKQNIIIEPVNSLLRKILQSNYGYFSSVDMSFCSFQANCAVKSMSLEPNGDLYICQEMADAGLGLLGNSINQTWNHDIWSSIDKRPGKLDISCRTCKFFQACQGGCMLQAIQDGNEMYGKPQLCSTWKALFYRMEELISLHGESKTKTWLESLNK